MIYRALELAVLAVYSIISFIIYNSQHIPDPLHSLGAIWCCGAATDLSQEENRCDGLDGEG